ncbi:peptidylprolyl isomerase [Qipengyuania sp. YG27]|uniref:Peptidylprolyl isomerase n=1 Tax=Qipengyuania mesophila TaxID=2867246 RepID=A0ABS7JVQ0_9SPHN|nr:peptidylprolyl isomerase [Qipengyuania mesophila]MBX7501666.1 peptidylprolyl isomerase [Qipengyuania mesophila]
MTRPLISLAALLALAAPAIAQEETPPPAPSPGEIVAQAPAEEWVAIAPEDLLVMTLAPAEDGSERKVVIQLMPAPFSQSWVQNIRTFARSGWFDDITVNRVQDNYVVQWGDPNYDNPESSGEQKALPPALVETDERDYTVNGDAISLSTLLADSERDLALEAESLVSGNKTAAVIIANGLVDSYAQLSLFHEGWPLASNVGSDDEGEPASVWPIHCYGMVGVGRNMSPDAGTGAELYTVIGHAPRHLDRNIALAGRIVEGMEHLSSLPRGSGALGFYTEEEADKRTPILSVRVASDLPDGERPRFEYLSTDGASFARYADARANRRDPFFIVPAGGADICNIPVPVRRVAD